MTEEDSKATRAHNNPPTIRTEWRSGPRTKSWEALWRRVFNEALLVDNDPSKSEESKEESEA